MRKEILYALIAGSFLGIVIAFGVWRAKTAFKPNGGQAPEAATPTPSGLSFGLTIAEPDDLTVLTENPVTLAGISAPENWIIISTETDDKFFQAAADGSFSQEINLDGGINPILVNSLDKTGAGASQSLTLVFSTEFIRPKAEASPSPTPVEATEESEIREKVMKKVQKVLDNPLANLGTVTDISANTLQIKTETDEIKQVSISPDTVAVKTKPAVKIIKLTDIAIGDFIVAMGYSNGNEILEARRILVTDPVKPLKLNVLLGQIAAVGKKTFTLANQEISLDKKTKIKLTDLDEGDAVIAVGQIKDNVFNARTVFLLPAPTASPSPTATPK